jgi:hypothetical protein
MSFEAKKERAIAIMESKKMWRNYAPPLLQPRVESWPQDPTVAFCHVLATYLADGIGLVRHGGFVCGFLHGRTVVCNRALHLSLA